MVWKQQQEKHEKRKRGNKSGPALWRGRSGGRKVSAHSETPSWVYSLTLLCCYFEVLVGGSVWKDNTLKQSIRNNYNTSAPLI